MSRSRTSQDGKSTSRSQSLADSATPSHPLSGFSQHLAGDASQKCSPVARHQNSSALRETLDAAAGVLPMGFAVVPRSHKLTGDNHHNAPNVGSIAKTQSSTSLIAQSTSTSHALVHQLGPHGSPGPIQKSQVSTAALPVSTPPSSSSTNNVATSLTAFFEGRPPSAPKLNSILAGTVCKCFELLESRRLATALECCKNIAVHTVPVSRNGSGTASPEPRDGDKEESFAGSVSISQHKWISLHIFLLARSKQFELAEKEINLVMPFANWSKCTIVNSLGAGLQFCMRLMAVHIPISLNKLRTARMRAKCLLSDVRDHLVRSQNATLEMLQNPLFVTVVKWRSRERCVLGMLANVYEKDGDIMAAVSSYQFIIDRLCPTTEERRFQLGWTSRLLQFYVRNGIMAEATIVLGHMESKYTTPEDSAVLEATRGFYFVGSNNYNAARACFGNAQRLLGAWDQEKQLASSSNSDLKQLISGCTNNLAICCMHVKQLLNAIDSIEALLRTDPLSFLSRGVVDNLFALYNFLPDGGAKKAVVNQMASAYIPEDLGAVLDASS